MDQVVCLRCMICGREYDPENVPYTCPSCGPEGILDVIYDYSLIARRFTKERLLSNRDLSIWRYLELLPLEPKKLRLPLHVGWTPLYQAEELGRDVGCPHLLVKDDGRNPTASFKDRASSIGVAKAIELGHQAITCASTGNAASSLSGVSASVGLRSFIFVPHNAPKAKVAQLLMYGAKVFLVQGTYDQAFDLCLEASREFGWYSRNTALGWRAPDTVFVSVGDGCIIGGLWKGFHDLLQLGFIDHMPRLVGVQAEGCQPIKHAFETCQAVKTVQPETMADSIAVGHPRDALKALRALRDSDGFMVAVSDQQILDAMGLLARKTGIFGEPAGVTGFAGLLKALSQERVDPSERVVVVVTGNGLKDVDSALRASPEPTEIEPSLEAVARELRGRS